ncbi:copper chaperone PCu(A)C [Vibrio harveyi]|jgi:copper(I)-binding protein|uniref:Copper chaperone PCu(A)C n=1 Tax=Vibrio harveyi TaxID=669 RepID=A0ABM5Y3T0_VIBHA|nr:MULTISPECIES: copper chaperone PCu(A)C [Vibrio]AMG00217.1 copper chaperone PCu(A)C [Vibrio harveyi]EKO3786073.1 copper chaperone PCu(A)C [Vibrio harveyi]EKO3815962.1 copper chaperone PCu(A)C [Vibrio harveyi]EKO3835029.1 copper chaperone PCu(A)C [Vibrio harveyi]EMR36601.1 hypothetical protein MUQ_12059 [Vibrio harveyi CAIM 1792]
MLLTKFRPFLTALITVFAMMSSAWATENLQEKVQIESPVIFQLASGAKGTGSKMTIHNNSDEALVINGFKVDEFDKTMLHGTKYEAGKRKMFMVKSITIPAHKKLALTPNTHHFMMFGPKRELELGEYLTMVVNTNQGDFKVIAQVVPRKLK